MTTTSQPSTVPLTTTNEIPTHIPLRFPVVLVLGALGLGLVADLLFYGRTPGISFPLFIALCLLFLSLLARLEGRPATPANRWLGPMALLFAILTTLRAEPTITVLNALTALGFFLLQIGLYRGVRLRSLAAGAYLIQMIGTAIQLGFRPFQPLFHWLRGLFARTDRIRFALPIVRGLVLALPVVGFFTILLMMADTIFADLMLRILTLNLPISLNWLGGHILLIGAISWLSSGAIFVALRAMPDMHEPLQTYPPPWGLGCIEGLIVIAAIDLLFGGFMLVQAAYLFGGLDTLAQTQMTYADYARRGFFELIAVATLTLGLIWLLVRATRRDTEGQRFAFNAAAAVLVLLTIGLLSSAFQRMWLYEQAYGFTHLRLYTHTFMIWLALALILCLAALLANRPRWLSFGGLLSAAGILASLTLANPEAIIVRANIARYQATGDMNLIGSQAEPVEESYENYRPSRTLDANYLAHLSPDATPVLLEYLAILPADERAVIQASLHEQRSYLEAINQQGWPSWHWARTHALVLLHNW